MSQFLTFAHALKNDEDGATMIEYTLLAGLVSIIVVATIALVGPEIQGIWGKVLTNMKTANGTVAPPA